MEIGLTVVLLNSTPNINETIAAAGRLCYSNSTIGDLIMKFYNEGDSAAKMVHKLVKLGHLSVLEHVSFTFGIEGISRACTHQLVRHRLASYSQQSQRYVRADDPNYIIADSIKHSELFERVVKHLCGTAELYGDLIAGGIPEEDARGILPNAVETKIVMTMNARELIHFFEKRCCQRAQQEIRSMAHEMLMLCRQTAPEIFNYVGPKCVSSACPEGNMSCGKQREMKELYNVGFVSDV